MATGRIIEPGILIYYQDDGVTVHSRYCLYDADGEQTSDPHKVVRREEIKESLGGYGICYSCGELHGVLRSTGECIKCGFTHSHITQPSSDFDVCGSCEHWYSLEDSLGRCLDSVYEEDGHEEQKACPMFKRRRNADLSEPIKENPKSWLTNKFQHLEVEE